MVAVRSLFLLSLVLQLVLLPFLVLFMLRDCTRSCQLPQHEGEGSVGVPLDRLEPVGGHCPAGAAQLVLRTAAAKSYIRLIRTLALAYEIRAPGVRKGPFDRGVANR